MIQKVLFQAAAAVSLCVAGGALAQSTPLQRQLSRLDLGVSGAGQFTQSVQGPVVPVAANQGQTLQESASSTVGALVNLRYIAKPLVGVEFNFVYARYTENFNGPGALVFNQAPPFQVQTGINEFTLGYIITPQRTVFGLHPYASAGMGSTEFKPTPHGGQGLPRKARATYYYSVGVQQDVLEHFGLRVGFRQTFFLAPDFGQNYFTILKHTSTYEPTAGFYLRF